MKAAIGLDTSCYVTSVAAADEGGSIIFNGRTPLEVKQGGLGLRQQEAVFAHIKNLPSLIHAAFAALRERGLQPSVVGVSATPRCVEGSYMPVFRAGISSAEAMAAALDVSVQSYSHQQGHLRAAEIGSANVPGKYIGVHLSGGTSEILAVDQSGYTTDIIGGSCDISAGQLLDRIGVAMGLAFPAGAPMEQLAMSADEYQPLKSSVDGAWFSFTGAEAECKRRLSKGASHGEICRALLECVAETLHRALASAREVSGLQYVLVGGGVAANALIKARLSDAVFAQPQFAGDNAAGIALLALESRTLDNQ